MSKSKFVIGDDVRIIETGERARVTDILKDGRYGLYVSAEDSADGDAFYDERSFEELY